MRSCPVCSKPFVVNDGHRAYCSDSCKMRAYRRRKLGLPIDHLGGGAGAYDLLFAKTRPLR